jgi:hypothetical protein
MDSTDDMTGLIAHVARLKDAAADYLSEQSERRQEAMEYYDGIMKDLPHEEGRSSAVSNDIRANLKKVMPSIMRTICGGGDVVKYLPVGQEDEEGAKQATDYINLIGPAEFDIETAIYDVVHEAALLKTGIIKWCAYRQKQVTIRKYTDQPTESVIGLFDDPDVEITDYSETEETDPSVLAVYPDAARHSFTLRRVKEVVQPKLEAVERGSFLITPGADEIETAELVGEELILPRSKLVEMGYDKAVVWGLRRDDGLKDDDQSRDGDDYSEARRETVKALQLVRVWEVYVRLDRDGDGIAELYRIVFGEGDNTENHAVLGFEEVDEAPYASVVIEREPGQFEGRSLFEDLKPVQRVKTAILRTTMDNMYAQLNRRVAYQSQSVENPEALTGGKFGAPLILKPGYKLSDAIAWEEVPFIAAQSFQMLEYWDRVATDRTGITDASGGLEAEDVSGTSATAASLLSERGIAQADMMVRTIATGGLRKAFRGLLKLVIAHSDGPRIVRMKGEWVQYDPRVWNAEMDCQVNIGLGGGTKERDMAVLQVIYGLQKELLLSMGADNVFVKPEQLYNTLEKITETAGFPSAQPYFTDPDPEEVQRKMDEAKNAPNPDVVKIEAQGKVDAQIAQMNAQTTLQLEQSKLNIQAQSEQMKAEVARDKEAAQMQADLATKEQESAMEAQLEAQKMAFEREKHQADLAMKERELQVKREIELLKLGARDSETGVVSKDDDRQAALVGALQQMLESVGKMNGPKRVIRDENGDVIGVEAVQ